VTLRRKQSSGDRPAPPKSEPVRPWSRGRAPVRQGRVVVVARSGKGRAGRRDISLAPRCLLSKASSSSSLRRVRTAFRQEPSKKRGDARRSDRNELHRAGHFFFKYSINIDTHTIDIFVSQTLVGMASHDVSISGLWWRMGFLCETIPVCIIALLYID
jgi:hypothetical protein